MPKNKVGKALCIGSMILRWPVTWKGCSDVSAEAGFADPAWGARSSPKSQKGATLKIHFCSNHTCRNSEIIHAFCKCCLSEALIRTSSDLLACYSLHQNLGRCMMMHCCREIEFGPIEIQHAAAERLTILLGVCFPAQQIPFCQLLHAMTQTT